ncbi:MULTISPECIES: formylglycine-generating enzyme family protein [unclassified Moorena]|uniref:formylglycine-generating enzyme family protein n=1 Tax=unclassified Moorena TaxID=2683338 RepID=UPI0013FED717|nr:MULTISPECIES: formylglycine-generating enzyme family protein [unclassified Moorena]NEO13522.1 formylglycine-generating enzyme family protein [Moorena sp. SIO3E8]NEP98517.1 formylglycine-generating enzyme family protein [Moorena sp. SIO3F7]
MTQPSVSTDIIQRIQSFRDKFGDPHLYFAYHAAFPIALTPDLLYCLWANFQQDIQGDNLNIPWIAVADLLLSPLCHEVGHELYEMEPETRNVLLEQLNSNPRFNRNNHQRIKMLAHFLLAYIKLQLNSPKNSVRTIAQAQRWTALAYIDPEAAARDLALQLTQLSLAQKTEWVRMSKLAETLAAPLREGRFEHLLIYLQGMRDLARGHEQGAASKFDQLPTHHNRLLVAGVTLPIPEFEDSVWNINTVKVPPPSLHPLDFETAELIQQPRFMGSGSQWLINRGRGQAEVFYEQLGENTVLEMVQIPGGEFQMGSPKKEGDYREQPQHLVNVAPFFLSRFPVTQAQWGAIARNDKVMIDLPPAPSRFPGEKLPVEGVTWFEAIEFFERLQLQTGRPYRLPSEAEWEYACRAGTATPFHFGETISPKVATYDSTEKYRFGPKGKSSKQTTEVGFHQAANGFGLEDLHGNVWEWCADHWYHNYIDAPVDGTARITNYRVSHQVIRGGSWIESPNVCRSGYRNGVPPENRILTIGFRVALSLNNTKIN